jgi:hypothetical protein
MLCDERPLQQRPGGLLAVVKFLSDTFGPFGQGQHQSLQDLLSILNGGGSYQAILGWMTTHYP